MKVYLVLLESFSSEFKGTTYNIYQFIEPKTMNIYNYSCTETLPYSVGDTLLCTLGVKRNKVAVKEVLEKYQEKIN